MATARGLTSGYEGRGPRGAPSASLGHAGGAATPVPLTAAAVENGERCVVLTRYASNHEWDTWAGPLPKECLEGGLAPAELKEAVVGRELLVGELKPAELEEYDRA